MIWTNWKETRILDIHMTSKYTWLKDLSSIYYERKLSRVYGYTRELDLTFYGKKILYFCGYWKTNLFLRLRMTLILVDHETSCIRNIISLCFHAYKERPIPMSYAACVLIWRQCGTGLRIENKYVKQKNVIWTNWK
jgi:hypothetical protein